MENNLNVLKERYAEIQKKHNLPSFEELNKEFGIEKTEIDKFDILIREIRRYVADKLLNYLRFIETVLNPSNASMFIFSFIKTLGQDEKDKMTDIYKKLAKIELDLIELDIEFNEEKEAEFIKKGHLNWKEISKDLMKVMSRVRENWDKESSRGSSSFVG